MLNLPFKVFEKEISLQRAKAWAEKLNSFERIPNYNNFKKSAQFTFDSMKQLGLQKVEKRTLKADGKTTYMDYVMPKAWDVEDARLSIINPATGEENETLASFQEEPLCLANRSLPTPPEGLCGELISYSRFKQGTSAQNCFVFLAPSDPLDGGVWPGLGLLTRDLAKKGVLGLVFVGRESYFEAPDSTYWINGWNFPGWYHTAETPNMQIFSITPRRGLELERRLKSSSIFVRALVKGKLYDGEIFTITGLIPGQSEQELVLMAHQYEPFLQDNALGVASILEIARILKKQKLLNFSVRLLVSMECYGFAEWFADPRNCRRTIFAMNMDGVSQYSLKNGLEIWPSHPLAPFFGDKLIEEALRRKLPKSLLKISPHLMGGDLLVSFPTQSVPTNWFYSDIGYHHNSYDCLDRLVSWSFYGNVICAIGSVFLKLLTLKQVSARKLLEWTTKQQCLEFSARVALLSKDMSLAHALFNLKTQASFQRARLMASTALFNTHGDLSDSISILDSTVKNELKKLKNQIRKSTSKEICPERSLASKFILKRLSPFPPFSMGKCPVVEQAPPPPELLQVLAFADGENALDEILLSVEAHLETTISDSSISTLITYLKKFEKYGYWSLSARNPLSLDNFLAGLSELGIKSGDKVVVHSALSRLGPLSFSPDDLCKALLKFLGPDGLLVMPSFNFYRAVENGGVYDFKQTKSLCGELTESFRKTHGVYRSLDPSHPFLAFGNGAFELVQNHHLCVTMGLGSPLDILEKAGGKALLVGIKEANTYHHVPEAVRETPCIGARTREYKIVINGKVHNARTWAWRNGLCPISDTGLYWQEMQRRNALKKIRIGCADVFAFKLSSCRKILEDYFDGKISPFLSCKTCSIRPIFNEASVKSDWDSEKKQLIKANDVFYGKHPNA